MSVSIHKTDGTELTSIRDGDANISDFPIALIGRLYRNYGQLVNENFVKLLENFANASSPDYPLTGQLWYDTESETLHVYRGDGFISLAVLTRSSAAPNTPNAGDMWYDTTFKQLKMYADSAWLAIAPPYTAAQGKSGVFVETRKDIFNADHVCVVTYVRDQIVSVHCRDEEWNPQIAISGLNSIKSGLNLAEIAGQLYIGTSVNSNALGGVDASQYLRNDQDGIIAGSLTVNNDGLIIGELEDLKISIQDTEAKFSKADGSINFEMGIETIMSITDSNQIWITNGSEAYPAITFIDETDTGLFKPTNSVIALGISGSTVAEFSVDGLYISGNIQVDNIFTGGLNTGTLSSTNLTTTNLNVLSTTTVNSLLINGNVTVGNAATDRITLNANVINAPNDLLLSTGDLTLNNNLFIQGAISGYVITEGGAGAAVAAPLTVTPGLYVDGETELAGDLLIGGLLNVGDLVRTDGGGRVLINSDVVPAYANLGDVTLGRTNGIRAYNTPKMWIAFNGTLSGLAVYDSFNIDFVTRTSANHYSFTTENPITSGAMAVVGTNGTQLVANPSIGAISFSITTTSESAQMALVVLSQ